MQPGGGGTFPLAVIKLCPFLIGLSLSGRGGTLSRCNWTFPFCGGWTLSPSDGTFPSVVGALFLPVMDFSLGCDWTPGRLFLQSSSRAHLHVVGMLRFMSDINQPSLPTPFYSVLMSISVFMALSTVYHSINSPDNSPLSHSVLPVLFLPYWSFQLCVSL